ncbi:uncharacterized protein LOC100901348 [Galendromus occidentalis]|uniref:Uncharacterized protein LOC100901348 n=1 Tax=Galendromus occidentalis TaxID=34638 RepID=A0AAJ6QS31_9ACAR|nr:uncharacterized protein LOC100901348 [Galendromus occidentalis]
MGRILSTLGSNYKSFKDVWENIQPEDRPVNLLMERLCTIERRGNKSSEQAFAAKDFYSSKNNIKRKNENKKMRFSCRKYQKLQQDRFLLENWICDSGASVHMMSNRN